MVEVLGSEERAGIEVSKDMRREYKEVVSRAGRRRQRYYAAVSELGENQVVWVVVGRVQDGIMTQKATKLDVCATAQHSAATRPDHCTLLLYVQLVTSAACRVMQ